MANAKIKTLTDTATGELLAPRTDAKAVRFDNTDSRLKSTTVEKALDEIANDTLCVRRNLLDNPRFKVNQRGETTYTASSSTHTIDRWTLYSPSSITLTVSDNGMTLTSLVNGSRMIQILSSEVMDIVLNKTITLSALTTDGVMYSKTDVVSDNTTIAFNFDNGNRCLLLSTSGTMQVQFVTMSANTTTSIKAVKLEIGEGQTLAYKDANGAWQLYDDYDYTADLLECQRYLYVIPDVTSRIVTGYSNSATTVIGTVNIPIQMIGRPTFNKTSTNNITVFFGTNYKNVTFSSCYNVQDSLNMIFSGTDFTSYVSCTISIPACELTCEL